MHAYFPRLGCQEEGLTQHSQFALALKQLLSGGRPVSQARAELRRLASTRSAYRGLAIVFSAYTLSTTLSKVSLAYISVPLQVVIKSGKLVPVMLGGRFITGRVYSRSEYAGAVLLVAGIALFSTAGGNVSTAAGHLSADAALSIGVGLLLLTLCADALLGNWQERTMHAADISPSQMMALQCSFAALLSGLAAVVTGELAMGIQLVHSSPQRGYICQQLLMYALVLLLGTIAVLTLVDEHGAAAAVLVTLVRKCSSMAFSYILYPKELGARHVLGALMVFASPYVAKRGGKAKVKALAPAEAQGDAQA